MTLQERILEALGDKAVPPQALYRTMSGENGAAVDAALRGLMKLGAVSYELGRYQRVHGKSVAAVMGNRPNGPVPAAAIAVLSAGPKPEEQTCKRCGAPKPLSEYRRSNLPGGGRLKTCNACMRLATGRRCTPEVIITGKDGSGPLVSIPSITPVETARAPSNEGAKEEVQVPRKITFSAGMKSRLVEHQRRAAEELQALLKQVSAKQQELADVEELVRIATAGEVA